MSNKKLSVLGMIAVLMAGWAVLQNRISQNVNVADFSSSPLIEGLQVEAISAITITSEKGAKTTTLNRSGKGFVVADKDNYPADIAGINRLINNCLDIRTHEKVTDNPDNHVDLKVTDETARYQVAFMDKDGNKILGFFVSESDDEGGAFARLGTANDVYSIQQPPYISARPMDYVDAQLLQIEQKQIASVAVRTGADSYILKASEDKTTVELHNMPEGKQFKGIDYKSVFGALNSLRFEDVTSVANSPASLEFDTTYTCKLDDQTVYKLVLAQKDEKTYAKISADYLDKSQVKVGKDDSEEQLKENEAKLLAMDAARAFTQKHQNWVYQVPSYIANNMTKPLAELLEDAPEPPNESEPADPNAA